VGVNRSYNDAAPTETVSWRVRLNLLVALAVVTPLGFATKLYRGPVEVWVANYLGGVLYEVFWILVVQFIRPSLSPWRVAGWVLAVTSALELAQLWHPPFLEAVRDTFVGRALIGTTFAWWDFPHYAVGCVIGALLVRRLSRG